jgi:uncharacterized membrane protein YphA (DoxX/SURF4 family)
MKPLFLWILRIVSAVILLQTLYFKFTASAESVYIFSTIGMEPYGRIMTGIMELIAAILIFIPVSSWLGAILGLGLMSGALFFHLTILGIEVQNDGGFLFYLGLIVFVCCALILLIERRTPVRLLKRVI